MRTLLNAVIGYFFLLLTVRVLSRRPGAQMTLFEFVIVFLIGGIVILATMGDDHSLTNSVCGVIMVGLLHRIMSYLRIRSPRFSLVIDGMPLVLLENGLWHTDMMRRMRIADTDVMAAARTKGVKSLSEIKYAVLERNGGISIIPR